MDHQCGRAEENPADPATADTCGGGNVIHLGFLRQQAGIVQDGDEPADVDRLTGRRLGKFGAAIQVVSGAQPLDDPPTDLRHREIVRRTPAADHVSVPVADRGQRTKAIGRSGRDRSNPVAGHRRPSAIRHEEQSGCAAQRAREVVMPSASSRTWYSAAATGASLPVR